MQARVPYHAITFHKQGTAKHHADCEEGNVGLLHLV